MKNSIRHVKRRAKIVATLGPATSGVEEIKKLIVAGMNVARVNMSHGDHAGHQAVIQNIREASRELDNREVAILLDLCGPKIRVSKLDEPLVLSAGETWFLTATPDQVKGDNVIPSGYANICRDCEVGDRESGVSPNIATFRTGAGVAAGCALLSRIFDSTDVRTGSNVSRIFCCNSMELSPVANPTSVDA